MKIYEIGTGYTPIPAQMGAATEIVVEELVKALQKQYVDVELLDIRAHQRKENSLPITEVPVPGCFCGTDVKLGVMHKLKRVVYSIALAKTLGKLIKNSEEQVLLHFHNQYNLFFFLKLIPSKIRAKAIIVYTVHSYIWPAPWPEIKDTVQKRYFQEITCVQNADIVLVLNDKTAEHFVRHLGVDESRIHKIGNGVNTEIYAPMEQTQQDAVKQELGLDGKKLIFQVGSVCDRKNQLGAVRMLCSYLQKNPNVVYVYAGGVIDEEYQKLLQTFAEEHGIREQVCYAGELAPGANLNKYYNAASVTIFPSKIESFGLVIIESLAAGTPVILTDQPLFALDKGYTVCRTEQAFLEQIHKHIHAEEKDRNIRDAVTAVYSWDKVAEDHMNIWKSICS